VVIAARSRWSIVTLEVTPIVTADVTSIVTSEVTINKQTIQTRSRVLIDRGGSTWHTNLPLDRGALIDRGGYEKRAKKPKIATRSRW